MLNIALNLNYLSVSVRIVLLTFASRITPNQINQIFILIFAIWREQPLSFLDLLRSKFLIDKVCAIFSVFFGNVTWVNRGAKWFNSIHTKSAHFFELHICGNLRILKVFHWWATLLLRYDFAVGVWVIIFAVALWCCDLFNRNNLRLLRRVVNQYFLL